MGALILGFLVALAIFLLAQPALRARFGRKPPAVTPDSPHEVVVQKLDDHRVRRDGSRPKSDDPQP